MKMRFCIFIILILNINLYGQKSKNRLVNNYHDGIDYYLSPDTTDFKREIMFISMPSFNSPEYSVTLETKDGNPILKLRSFKSNYWELVFSKRSEDTVMVESKIDSFAVNVSQQFEDKLRFFFQSVLQDDLPINSRMTEVYDGTTYFILNKKYRREVRENDFSNNRNYYQLVKVCESIANDLVKGIFNETKYLGLIDQSIQTKILK